MSDQAAGQSKATDDQSKFKIKVDGVEKEVTRDEIISMAQKGDDYTRKTQAISDKEKELKTLEESLKPVKQIYDEMAQDKGLADTLDKTYKDYKSGKISISEMKDKNLKTLDKKIDEAKNRGDHEALESLRDVRSIIEEETNTKGLLEEVKKLREEVSSLRSSTIVSLDSKISGDWDKLKDSFGKSVDKYEKVVREAAAKYPGQSVEKLFKYYADESDLDEALIHRATKNKEKEIQKKRDGSMDTTNSIRELIEPKRDKFGRVDLADKFIKIKEKYNLSRK